MLIMIIYGLNKKALIAKFKLIFCKSLVNNFEKLILISIIYCVADERKILC